MTLKNLSFGSQEWILNFIDSVVVPIALSVRNGYRTPTFLEGFAYFWLKLHLPRKVVFLSSLVEGKS